MLWQDGSLRLNGGIPRGMGEDMGVTTEVPWTAMDALLTRTAGTLAGESLAATAAPDRDLHVESPPDRIPSVPSLRNKTVPAAGIHLRSHTIAASCTNTRLTGSAPEASRPAEEPRDTEEFPVDIARVPVQTETAARPTDPVNTPMNLALVNHA